LGYKDVRLAVNLSQKNEIQAPVCMVVHNKLFTAVAQGLGDRDLIEAFDRGVSEDSGS